MKIPHMRTMILAILFVVNQPFDSFKFNKGGIIYAIVQAETLKEQKEQ